MSSIIPPRNPGADDMPEEPEALGLLALMLHAEARRLARRSPAALPDSVKSTPRQIEWSTIRLSLPSGLLVTITSPQQVGLRPVNAIRLTRGWRTSAFAIFRAAAPNRPADTAPIPLSAPATGAA